MICSLALACVVLAASDCPANADATVTKAVAPDYPDTARSAGLPPMMTVVQVTVDTDGKPKDVQIYKTSGREDIDRESIRAAKLSQYSAKIVGCQPVVGDYLFRVEYWPDGTNLGQFLSAPSFAAPAGWLRNPNATAAEGFKEFNEWTSGGDSIGTMAAFARSWSDLYIHNKAQLLQRSGATITANESVKLCNGTAAGWKFEYALETTHYEEVLEFVGTMRVYEAYFYGPDAPSKAVSESLITLCAPAT
jgi:TonB family protein